MRHHRSRQPGRWAGRPPRKPVHSSGCPPALVRLPRFWQRPATRWPRLSPSANGIHYAAAPAGEPIATRWTPEIKEEVKRSRVATTAALAAAINACPAPQRPKVLVNASAVGYYGNSEVSGAQVQGRAGEARLAWPGPGPCAQPAAFQRAVQQAGRRWRHVPPAPGRNGVPRVAHGPPLAPPPPAARPLGSCSPRPSARRAARGATIWRRCAARGRRRRRTPRRAWWCCAPASCWPRRGGRWGA